MADLDDLRVTSTPIRGTFYRYHSKRYFNAAPEEFYKNFLATPRSFEGRGRFAPRRSHCGYYFGSSEFVASAEALFYSSDPEKPLAGATSENVFETYGASKQCVLLAVDIDIDEIADLTHWKNVRSFFDTGFLRWSQRRSRLKAKYLATLISPASRGCDVTDVIGWALFKKDFTGVRFPSVRALLADGSPPVVGGIRQRLQDIQNMSAAENAMDLGWQAIRQMRLEFNLVVFSDTLLAKSISTYSWLDGSGDGQENVPNPYYGKTESELEKKRLEERARLGLPAVGTARRREELAEVLSLGLLSEAERDGEFYCNTAFIGA